MYFNCYCSCSIEPEIIKIGESSHKMYSNNILNVKEFMTILNTHPKKSGNLSYAPRIFLFHHLCTPRESPKSTRTFRVCLRGVMVNALDCGIVISHTITFTSLLFFGKDGFGIK